jgi:hypothetical protein
LKKKIYLVAFVLLAFLLPATHVLTAVPSTPAAGDDGHKISAISHLPQSKLEHAGLHLLHVAVAKQPLKHLFFEQYRLNATPDPQCYIGRFQPPRDFFYTKETLRHNYPSHNFW